MQAFRWQAVLTEETEQTEAVMLVEVDGEDRLTAMVLRSAAMEDPIGMLNLLMREINLWEQLNHKRLRPDLLHTGPFSLGFDASLLPRRLRRLPLHRPVPAGVTALNGYRGPQDHHVRLHWHADGSAGYNHRQTWDSTSA